MQESSFKFCDPRLIKLEYELRPEFKKKDGVHFQNSFSVAINRAQEKKEAIVELTIVIGDSEKSENIPYGLLAIIGAKFYWNVDYDESMIGSLLSINAPALLLSYARPIIASITNASGRKAFNIPFIDFTNSISESFLQGAEESLPENN